MNEDLPLPQTDHDLIVTMVATNKLNQSAVLERLADVKTDIAELKGNFSMQNADLNSRLKVMEALAISSNPTENLRKLEKHENFINDYIATHKDRNARWGWYLSIIALLIAAYAALVGHPFFR